MERWRDEEVRGQIIDNPGSVSFSSLADCFARRAGGRIG